jgi:hypothetical protein
MKEQIVVIRAHSINMGAISRNLRKAKLILEKYKKMVK